MKKNLPVKSYLLRLCAVIALVGLIAYTLYHVAFSSEGSLMTTPSRKVTDTQTLTAKGYLFRHESVLYAEGEGLLYSLVSDGTKASKNTPLVEHRAQFSGGALATAQQKLDALCRSIAILEAGQSAVGAPLTQANDHRAEANALRISIKQMLGHTDRLSLAQSEDALLVALNRYAAVIGNDGAADALLNELRAERDALLSSPATVYYNTESSGRFYSRDFVDGYESLFTPEALQALNTESFHALTKALQTPAQTEGFAVGKIVYDHIWNLALRVPSLQTGSFEVGKQFEASFPENHGRTLELTCTNLIPEASGDLIAVFSCEDSPADFQFLRAQSVKLTFSSTEGYYVPASALVRLEDGAAGVYIFESRTVRWRWVVVLYEGNGYCIVEEQNGRQGYLGLNDLLITYGTDLYDGRVYE
ncbi:MAG: hypothetical protein IKB75_06370 [Clostridia bacterium]|nr:hypothetical protein [Clostridia bacterium]